ncbi:hypothetical protein BJV78DRAFT_1275443 [Lactifluus subvellereus]|nr:hypothetical protein BJV78DRAFT_1275443 [Lactifluus subvellereus]
MADGSSTPRGIQPPAYQVGGHKGLQITEDGTLLMKPALPLELQFYQNTLADPTLAPLRQWVPTYLGTLRLEGQSTAEGLRSVDWIPEREKDECIAIFIENLIHGFRKPNILDIKLGTVLYDEDAPPDKKERMQNAARRTTSGETGVRLTGFQVFDNKTSQPIIIPKTYGKSISTSELPAGIARFFPVGGSMTTLSHPSHARRGLSGTQGEQMDVGLPGTLLLPILRSIRKSTQEIRDVLSTTELRLVGSSLLVIYEGDWDRAEMGVQWLARNPTSTTDDKDQQTEDEGAEIEGDGDVQDSEGVEEEEEDDTSEGDSEDGGNNWPCVARLIDFGHTRLKPGQGPDPGVLKGLETVLNLLDGRIASVECML